MKPCPKRYAKYFGLRVISFSVGFSSLRMWSRSHMAVWGWSRPMDRYSAMPSTTHSGIWNSRMAPPLFALLAMLNWKACTSSCPRILSVSR